MLFRVPKSSMHEINQEGAWVPIETPISHHYFSLIANNLITMVSVECLWLHVNENIFIHMFASLIVEWTIQRRIFLFIVLEHDVNIASWIVEIYFFLLYMLQWKRRKKCFTFTFFFWLFLGYIGTTFLQKKRHFIYAFNSGNWEGKKTIVFLVLASLLPPAFGDILKVFESMVMIVFQSIFHSEKYINNVFLFFKNYF
jgi:hypothetical protein